MKHSLTLAYGSALLLALFGLLLISPPAMAQEEPNTCAGLSGRELECCWAYSTNDDLEACCNAGLIDTNPVMTPEEETNCDCYRSGDGGPKLNCFSCIAPQQVEDLRLLLKINQAILAPMNITLTEDTAAGKVTVAFDETDPPAHKSFEMSLCPCSSPQGQPRFACPMDGMGSILCASCIHPNQIDDVIGPSPKPYFNVPGEPIPPISFDTEFGCYRVDGLHFVEEEPPINICLPKCVCEGPAACPTPPTEPPPPPPPPSPPAAALEVPLLVCREGERDAYLSTGERVTLDHDCPVYPSFKLTDAPPTLLTLSEVMAGVVRTGQWSEEATNLSFQYLESALQAQDFFATAGIKGVSLAGYKIVEAPLSEITQKFLTSEGKIIREEGGLIELPSTQVTPSSGQTALTTATRISAAAGLRILTDRIKQQGSSAPAALTVDPFDIPMIVAIRIHSEGGGCSLMSGGARE